MERRQFIAGSAIAALSVSALPIAATNTSAERNERWQRAKGRFLNAHQRAEAASKASDDIEAEQVAFAQTAPEREVIYTTEGWRISGNGMTIDARPKDAQFVLNRHTLRHATPQIKATPEYAAYVAELDAWRDRYNAQNELRGWDRVEKEWDDALDAKCEAWRAMVACPVSSASDMAEKMRLARLDRFADHDAGDLCTLLDALQSDLARCGAH